jgi:hypothetical protein
MTHSPAPWTAFQDPMRRWTIGNVTHRICDMWGSSPAFFTDEDAANARLIAAAPDLLAALEESVAELCLSINFNDAADLNAGEEPDGDPDTIAIVGRAEAAIDKATKEVTA